MSTHFVVAIRTTHTHSTAQHGTHTHSVTFNLELKPDARCSVYRLFIIKKETGPLLLLAFLSSFFIPFLTENNAEIHSLLFLRMGNFLGMVVRILRHLKQKQQANKNEIKLKHIAKDISIRPLLLFADTSRVDRERPSMHALCSFYFHSAIRWEHETKKKQRINIERWKIKYTDAHRTDPRTHPRTLTEMTVHILFERNKILFASPPPPPAALYIVFVFFFVSLFSIFFRQ